MNNIQGKIWGDTQLLFFKNNVEIHRINTRKGGFCSKHKHDYKFNAFYIETGKMKITAWKNDYDLVDTTIITEQQMTVVPPREFHMFEALEDTVAYEIYWVDLPKKDIVRENHGGAAVNNEGFRGGQQ